MMANRRSVDADVQRNVHGKECFVCKKTSNYMCSRCLETYCSKQCQTVDWSKHKYYCFEMPELIVLSPQHNGQQVRRDSNPRSDNRTVNQSPQNGYRNNDRRDERERPHSYEEFARSAKSTQPALIAPSFTFADPPKNNDDVVFTHVKSANNFYIRACSSDSEYIQNAKDFDQWGQNGSRLMGLPRRDDVVLAKSSDKKFHRAVVLNVESYDRIKVALADTGRTLHKSVYDMRSISKDLIDRKRYNYSVKLEHLPIELERKLFSKLHDFVKDETVFVLQFDGDEWKTASNFNLLEKHSGLPIEIAVRAETINGAPVNNGVATIGDATKTASTTQNVRQRIESPNVPENTNECKKSKEELITTKKLTIQDLTFSSWPDVANLIITDNSTIEMGFVSAISKKHSHNLLELHSKVAKYGDADNEIYIPKPDELCLVKFEDEWYRSVELQSKYLLIDFGSLETIDNHNIRRFPAELTDQCVTFVCNIEGFTKDRVEDFKKLFKVDMETIHSKSICVKSIEDPKEYSVTFAAVRDMIRK